MKIIQNGLLIVIEGIDGSGKTTLVQGLFRKLHEENYDVITLKEPSNSEWGKKIRTLNNSLEVRRQKAREELELFILDRKENVAKNIVPALQKGKIIILDRYYFSTIAYQGALGIDPEEIYQLNAFAPRPNGVILLDISSEQGLTRAKKRSEDHLTQFERNKAYLSEVRKLLIQIIQKEPNKIILDASKSQAEILEKVWQWMKAQFKI
ncbi:MAG: dTMP kinase [Candidatus Hermodarchaeota archaeon]